MPAKKNPLRAIDLYSGVGGWSLGLSLAGVEVVCSYEKWGAANETNFKNNHHDTRTVDIRRLSPADLPSDIDVVVGSPPCTQFSYSNRGGSGDTDDGLEDIIKFFEVVDRLQPTYWAMENVPRTNKIILHEMTAKNGRLSRFRHLGIKSKIVSMDDFGIPQRRKRCIVSNADFDLLQSYSTAVSKVKMSDVVDGLDQEKAEDKMYGLSINRNVLTDHVAEDDLNEEEVRINRANKSQHPVYNRMKFPDPIAETARTITATCTRVSRESIVIEPPHLPGRFRRLTLRERACIQGFPVTYQFYAKSHGQKSRMIGNALPPPFAYLMGHVFLGTSAADLPSIANLTTKFVAPSPPAPECRPDRAGAKYRKDRSFRFAVPSLRLASGVRFELANVFEAGKTDWLVRFVFGTPKAIQTVMLDQRLLTEISKVLPNGCKREVSQILDDLTRYTRKVDSDRMQAVWSHSGPGQIRPFMVLDELDAVGERLKATLDIHRSIASAAIRLALECDYQEQAGTLVGIKKLTDNSPTIFAGMLAGSCFNSSIAQSRLSSQKRRAKGDF